jgi:hypothetical protein
MKVLPKLRLALSSWRFLDLNKVLHLNHLKPNLNEVKGEKNVANLHDQGLIIFFHD